MSGYAEVVGLRYANPTYPSYPTSSCCHPRISHLSSSTLVPDACPRPDRGSSQRWIQSSKGSRVVSLSFESVAAPSRVKARDMPYGASSPGRIVGGMRCRRYECIRKYKRQRLWILAFARIVNVQSFVDSFCLALERSHHPAQYASSVILGINAKKSWFLAWAERPIPAKLGVGRSPARVLLFITGLPC